MYFRIHPNPPQESALSVASHAYKTGVQMHNQRLHSNPTTSSVTPKAAPPSHSIVPRSRRSLKSSEPISTEPAPSVPSLSTQQLDVKFSPTVEKKHT
ncbi:hypothetical protein P168DRAFT_58772 [Aspergillus campestris IBT 28561]|uniref:Uncharacterized protein n=1 Tax=Aspergillus campestris (strain IBT 28561) TaxID=1392248 RepID=A0A2I1CTZ1_ASPC2|nr:uncharacterized protein P168DRAFT_58772 [Aspergillus campestris IBT 28561]PKY01081.1 hypothetical protein P168DRAFT_58772 [Aspergillus campestris IBT 28561]